MCTASLMKPHGKFMTACSWRFDEELETAETAHLFEKN